MEYIKKEELIKGEIYKVQEGSFSMIELITLVDSGNNDLYSKRGNATCITTKNEFRKDSCWCYMGSNRNIINATPEEKHWLNSCITADKFITFEEAIKTFVPEYVECVLNENNSKYKLGKIYKRKCDILSNEHIINYQNNRYRFKPSTKEAYDAQFVVKEPEFVLPELWHIVITPENYKVLSTYFINKHPQAILYTNGIMGIYKKDILGHTQNNVKGSDYDFGIEITLEQFKKYVLKEETAIEYPIDTKVFNTQTNAIYFKQKDGWYMVNNKTAYTDEIINKSNYINIVEKTEVIEPLPQFKIIETIETITKVENNEGNQFFIGDIVKSSNGVIQTIKSFGYNKNKTNIIAFTNKQSILGNGIGIDKIEHYIEPKEKVKEETLLEKAKRLYPIGTKFRAACNPKYIGTVKDHNDYEYQDIDIVNLNTEETVLGCTGMTVFYEGKWAEIIK